MGIQLPSRKWYTLEQAAAKLSREAGEEVTIADLVHFWITRQLEFSVELDYSNFNLNIAGIKLDDIQQIQNLQFSQENDLFKRDEISSIQFINSNSDFIKDRKTLKESLDNNDLIIYLNGLFSILNTLDTPQTNREKEIVNKGMPIKGLFTFSTDKAEKKQGKNYFYLFLDTPFYIPLSNIYILQKHLDNFKQGKGVEYDNQAGNIADKLTLEKPQSTKTLNHQIGFIRDLLIAIYGEDYPNQIRRELDNAQSEIRRDFEMKGLTPPSGKTVENWLNK